MRHVVVYREQGRFAGWPANGGIWSWGNESVVAFKLRYLKPGRGFHAVDPNRPTELVQARSLDGGETWRIEEQGLHEIGPDGPGLALPAEGFHFTHPDFALMFTRVGVRAGAKSWINVSYDRCRTWHGPYGFPSLGLPGVAARTDFLPAGPDRYLFFMTAAKANGDEGHAFCAETADAGRSFAFRSWIGPEPDGWTIMPASVRLPDARILVALRCREGNRHSHVAQHWIDLYASEDDGATWSYLNRPAPSTGKGGNPPTLTRLQDGRLCLTYGYRAAPFGMRARLSCDNGDSWGPEIVLRDGGGNHDIGYPRTVQRPDGTVVTIYYFNDHADGERYIEATLWKP